MGKGIIDTNNTPQARLQTVPLGAVRMAENGFWGPLRRGNVERGLPKLHDLLEQNGHMDNFRRLAGKKAERRGPLFTDSDLYKWIEAVGYVLQFEKDPELQARTDAVIAEIAAVQEEDGYLNTYYIEERKAERYQHLEYSHEMYCAGHLMQGAVAYHRATGNDTLLQVACKFADHLAREFGPGKREITDGHPEVELALVELYRETGEKRYLDLAGFFLSKPQSSMNLPPIAQREALVGHAVRSAYICAGGADWVLETGDQAMQANLESLWRDLLAGKIYVTGGVGSRYEGEAFGEPYELPNARAYAETCAQIGHFMWAFRMLLLTGRCEFAEVMEWILYNGLRSGVSLGGDEYFYMNPLSYDGGEKFSATGHRVPPPQRSTWHGCTCCPPNVQRLLASLPGYMLATDDKGIYVNLYDECDAEVGLGEGMVKVTMRTQYPWQDTVHIDITPEAEREFAVRLRIPAWAHGAAAMINGRDAVPAQPGEYLTIERTWRPGDNVTLHLPMKIEALVSHPRVSENRGAVALRRGPVVYCVESVDNPEADVTDLQVAIEDGDLGGEWEARHDSNLLGGVTVLEGPGFAQDAMEDTPLYMALPEVDTGCRPVMVTAIPYYAWANRGKSKMRVWLGTTEAAG